MNPLPHVVILGAGYGGLVTAIRLQKMLNDQEADVTLVNKHDYHYLTAHLHKPAAGTDRDDNACISISELIDDAKVHFVKSTVLEIQPEQKKVVLEDRVLSYDYLVIGLGSEPETFGIPGVREYAFKIRSINSVRLIRTHIEYMFAKYKLEPHRTDYLTFVIGGSGLTGTEFVGELADRLPDLCKKYRVDSSLVNIYNVEMAPQALPMGLPSDLVDYGMDVLRRKGITYQLSTAIKECTPEGVVLGSGEFIKAATVIWTGGVRGNHLLEEAGFETVKGRVKVDEYLRDPRHPDVFIVGDCSMVQSPEGTPYPPSAQLAVRQGANVARNLAAILRNQPLKPFQFDYKGTVASLGKHEAVGVVNGKKVKGRVAAWIKRIIDARYLLIIGGVRLFLKKIT
ncbi:NAD(P)/FAD-dependent oxidoreductase [Lihuaxuella thermophila]|uniref:NADH dehydrogenase n=1 Tax=Lihuaxuella thermophila TaxID=1173111 RepID=A0A1H8FQP9_9BACL|nr:NAD(P)/FAD-dependent oxidoreductase [Lihuaxuella thermophila]SEN34043.1 NADH dehydrogenase [Lihuaxuella thermophila]